MALYVELDVDRHMAALLANGGVRPLPATQVRRIKDYAHDVFGGAAFFPWLHFYAVYRGAFHEGWVPENYVQSVAMPFLNGAYHKLCNARTLQRRLLGCASMPDVAYLVGGEWFDLDGNRLDPTALRGVLFREDREVCLKTEHSMWGRGVSFETCTSFEPDRVAKLGNLVAQRVIRQAPWLDAIYPGAVATIRVATGKPEGARPRLVGSFLRVGFGATRAVGDDSIEIPILDASGALYPWGEDETWRRIRRHPDSGFVFEGATLPEFDRVVAHCLALHDRLPQFGFIGWDAVIDRDGAVQVMEFNTAHPDTRLLEMTLGPCFRDFRLEQYKGMARKDVWA